MEDFVPFDRTDIEASIPALFDRQVRVGPARIAVSDGHNRYTYAELDRWSNRIAQGLLRLRGDGEEPVTLLFRQSAAAVAATLGTLKAGKIYVPLDPNESESELRQVVSDCRPSLIVSDAPHGALANSVIGRSGEVLDITNLTATDADEDPGLDIGPERLCYIFYTSGTTGPRKGVCDNHRNVLHNVMRYTNSLKIGSADRLSLIESCGYSGTVSSMFSALLNGAAICPFDLAAEGISRMADWLDAQAITIFHAVPTIFEQLLARRRSFDSLRMIRLEGDRTEPRHIALFQERFDGDQVLVNGLGLTEAGIVRQFFVRPGDRMNGSVVPIGQAAEDMEVTLIGEDGGEVLPGEVGEIVVRSDYLACGYWRRPDLTQAKFSVADGRRAYHTGDLGRLRANGLLDYLGRQDFQAKLRGQWIETAAIEQALVEAGGVEQALVMVRDDGLGTQQLVAYLVAADPSPSADHLRETIGKSLPPIMVPARFVFVDRFPEDRNGKVDRRALPAPGRDRPPLARNYRAPRDAREEIVAACFRELLRLDRVGVDDDFLDLGGDSLLAAELLERLHQRMGIPASSTFINNSFSVASLAERLGEALPEGALVRLQQGDGRAPLYCVHNYEGTLLEYSRLVHALGPDQPVFGLQSRAYSSLAALDASVEAMAAAYVQEITAFRSHGPFHLCGNCFGGVIAFEMARQLQKLGHDVGLLALIDTEFPVGFLRRTLLKITNPQHWRWIAQLPMRQQPGYLATRLSSLIRDSASDARRSVAWNRRPTGGAQPLPTTLDQSAVFDWNRAAFIAQKPVVYDGAMVLFCVGPPHDQRGWLGLAKQGCRLIELPLGDRLDAMPHLTTPPYVTLLAQHLTRLIEEIG